MSIKKIFSLSIFNPINLLLLIDNNIENILLYSDLLLYTLYDIDNSLLLFSII